MYFIITRFCPGVQSTVGISAIQNMYAAFSWIPSHQKNGLLRVRFALTSLIMICKNMIRYSVLTEEQLQIILYAADAGNAEVLNENISHIRGKEGRECRSEVNVLYAQA
jgi:hypothetical protein